MLSESADRAPASVFCWTTRTGGTRWGSRDTRWMGGVVPYRPVDDIDKGTCWRPGPPPPVTHERRVRHQGIVSRVSLYRHGYVTEGWLVAGDDPERLHQLVATEWRRGWISWWAHARIGAPDGTILPAVALDQGATARRIAERLAGPFLAHLVEDTLTVERPSPHAYHGVMTIGHRPFTADARREHRQAGRGSRDPRGR
ncbi:MAG: hypothetical protein KatS3mg009_1219 [Acidimicrobiia bacterium]|nr:MAG: hypothetical protein KatS3mg009_1219 [Acidimicrobiia bacterium]